MFSHQVGGYIPTSLEGHIDEFRPRRLLAGFFEEAVCSRYPAVRQLLESIERSLLTACCLPVRIENSRRALPIASHLHDLENLDSRSSLPASWLDLLQ